MMKEKILLLVFLLVSPCVLFAQGIHFEALEFEEALAKAKKESKYVLLDCYTTWCGPCKQMATEVFTSTKAGEYFNERFVSIKIDMEKGEGVQLAKRLKISSYPTFMVFKSDGTLATRFSGACSVDVFIAQVERGIKQEISYEELGEKYENNQMSQEEIVEYVALLTEGGESKKAVEIAEKMLRSVKEKKRIDRKYWPLYENWAVASMASEHFDFILKHKKEFDKAIGQKWVDNKITRVYEAYLYGIYAGNIIRPLPYDEAVVQSIEKAARLLGEENRDLLLARCAFARARANKDPEGMVSALERFVDSLSERDLWGVTSAFYNAGGLRKVGNRESVKAIGRKIVNKAEEKDKYIYEREYYLED